MVESSEVFRRRTFHRRKAHLVLSALRHRAAQAQEEGRRVDLVRTGTYRQGLLAAGVTPADPVDVVAPTTWGARRLVERLRAPGAGARGAARARLRRHPGGVRRLGGAARAPPAAHGRLLPRGPRPPPPAAGGRRLTAGWLVGLRRRQPRAGAEGGRHPGRRRGRRRGDAGAVVAGRGRHRRRRARGPGRHGRRARRRPPPRRAPREGDGSRALFVGHDGPRRFAVTRAEALAAMRHFLDHRLGAFGTYEDAMLAGDRWMAHSLLSAPMNLGLLHPLEAARAAEAAHRERGVRLASVEGYVAPAGGLARLRLAPVLAPGRGLPPRQRAGRPRRPAALVARPGRAGHRGRALPVRRAGLGARGGLGPPRPAPDGAGQLRPAARVEPAAAGRVDARGLRRRLRLGHGGQRGGDEPARRRRGAGPPSRTGLAGRTSTG